MTSVEVFNLVASIFGIVTGIVALSLAIIFYLSARNSEKNSDRAMAEINSATSQLSKLSMKLLDRLTSALVSPRPIEEKLVEAIKELAGQKPAPKVGIQLNEVGKPSKEKIEQWRIDNLILAMFYAAKTNLSTQKILETIPEGSDPTDVYRIGLDDSANAYRNILKAILSADDYEKKINLSPINSSYIRAKNIESNIKTCAELFNDLPEVTK